MGVEAYFIRETHCPVCGEKNITFRFPIDERYAYQHTGIDTSETGLGVVSCDRCSHQFIAPIPTGEFLSRFYASYMSSAKSGFYQARAKEKIPESFRAYYSPWLERIKSACDKDCVNLLDVGCGLGMFLRLAREKGFDVQGVEPNKEAVDRLDSVYSIKAHHCLLEDYSGEERFDAVTMWDLLEHLAQPKNAIQKIHSILHPNGLLVLEIPIRDSLLHWTAKGLFRLSFGKIQRPLFLTYGVHHLQYFSERSIIEFVEHNGFKVVEHERAETSLDALRKNGGGLKAELYNHALAMMFSLARLIGKQNKLVLIARKIS